MAVNYGQKSSAGSRPPPPPISSDMDFYDSLEDPQQQQHPHQLSSRHFPPSEDNARKRRSLPPVPIAGGDEYTRPDEENEIPEYLEEEYLQPDEFVPSSTAGPQFYMPTEIYDDVEPQNSPPTRQQKEDFHQERPLQMQGQDNRPYNNNNQRAPVSRKESYKKEMGVSIVNGLNTARVKEVKGRLKPAFSAVEIGDINQRRISAGSIEHGDENIDVSGLSVMERLKLIEAKAAKKAAPPPVYPKPRAPGGQGYVPAAASSNPNQAILPSPYSPPKENKLSPSTSNRDDPGPNLNRRSDPKPLTLDDLPWFFGLADRHESEGKLKNLKKEGAFLIRASNKANAIPYTLCIYHEHEIYNIMIRRKENGKLAVGSEKKGEPEFPGLLEMVEFHTRIAIPVIPRETSKKSTTSGGSIWLTTSPQK